MEINKNYFNTKARKKTNPKHPNVSMACDKNVCWPCIVNFFFFFFNLPGCSWNKFRPLTTGIPQSPDISHQVADIFLPNGQIARDRVDLNRDPFDP